MNITFGEPVSQYPSTMNTDGSPVGRFVVCPRWNTSSKVTGKTPIAQLIDATQASQLFGVIGFQARATSIEGKQKLMHQRRLRVNHHATMYGVLLLLYLVVGAHRTCYHGA